MEHLIQVPQDDDVDDKRSGDEWRTGYSDLTCCKLGKLGVVGEPDLGQTIPFARCGKHPQLRRTGFGRRQDEDDNQEEEDGRCSRTNREGLRMDSHWTWNGVSSRSRYRSPWKKSLNCLNMSPTEWAQSIVHFIAHPSWLCDSDCVFFQFLQCLAVMSS